MFFYVGKVKNLKYVFLTNLRLIKYSYISISKNLIIEIHREIVTSSRDTNCKQNSRKRLYLMSFANRLVFWIQNDSSLLSYLK